MPVRGTSTEHVRFAAPWAAGESFRTATATWPGRWVTCCFCSFLVVIFSPFFSQPLGDPGRACVCRKSKVGITSAEQAEECPRRRGFLLSPLTRPQTLLVSLGSRVAGGTSPASAFADAGRRQRRKRGGEEKAPAGANGQDGA